METNNLFNNLIQRNQSAAFSSGKVRPNHETNINIIARRTGKDVNSHTVLDGIITTIMATIQRINIIGSREGSRNRRRLKANQTGKKFRVGIKRADKGKDTRDYLAAAFPELNAWERAGADASSAGMVDAGFENQKELTKMQLDNQKEIAEMQNETQKEIAGIQSATSRQNTK